MYIMYAHIHNYIQHAHMFTHVRLPTHTSVYTLHVHCTTMDGTPSPMYTMYAHIHYYIHVCISHAHMYNMHSHMHVQLS